MVSERYREHRYREMLRFQRRLRKTGPKDRDIHITSDKYAIHKHPNVIERIERQNRVFLHFMPTSSSWLELVERFFGMLTRKQLCHAILHSVYDLERSIMDYIAQARRSDGRRRADRHLSLGSRPRTGTQPVQPTCSPAGRDGAMW